MTWFETLFGFKESDVEFEKIKHHFEIVGTELICKRNGKRYQIGEFASKSVKDLRDELRAAAGEGGAPGSLRFRHIIVGDIFLEHSKPENHGAVFQVASQFNCLEFTSPHVKPEHGITGYQFDGTQGPACSLACGAATLYRNYFAETRGEVGQSADNQINNLEGVEALLAERTRAGTTFFRVRSGYVNSSSEKLSKLKEVLEREGPTFRTDLVDQIRIGVHRKVEVNFSRRFEPFSREGHWVSQMFCSAISCGYTMLRTEEWREIGTIVLDGVYEGTLLEAAVEQVMHAGTGKVFLTFIGGGVFANSTKWIGNAIGRSLALLDKYNLDVNICHYRAIDKEMEAVVEKAREMHLRRIRAPAAAADQ